MPTPPDAWYRSPASPSLLTPLSWVYGAVMGLRRAAYACGLLPVFRSPCPVIVVGNLSVGGTGKTPLTLWLAEALRAEGEAVGILSRGYGRAAGGLLTVDPDGDWREAGDEPLLLRRRSGCPTVVSADRAAGARRLAELGAGVILCDDGLQHLKLARDLEIVVIDGARGFGNGRLLPAGPLREPAPALERAALAVVNGAPVHPTLQGLTSLVRMDLAFQEARALHGGEPRALASFLAGPVHAVAAIGNPQRFFAQLRSEGLTVIEHPFADHQPLTAADLDFGDGRPVLMTEKDAVKCASIAAPGLWFLPVTAQFSPAGAATILTRVRAALAHFRAARR